ncbi:MAG: hypothetical protein GWM98_08255, partial [Nitrospinaceae bacterium]|nr:hypothetical protein [Nitrospinaceae bacterium]NIR54490.1 hypothetical protein [Nitrospinaceae bacterium]NIS84909.1 hypothetical protein [Nitrospinaceae bacterium]NIT81723.1 hypothetical protein [Nitrospinaceae bacterium]NIU43992.1 hypothetical protein [Nitrospinaceae bacterium]
QLEFQGIESLHLDAEGNLVVQTPHGNLVQQAPVAYQETQGTRTEVNGKFQILAANRVGFQLGPYDPTQPLILDPVLRYSTYLGGSQEDEAHAIAVDSKGHAYIAGTTFSTDFPLLPPKALDLQGLSHLVIAKLKPDGSGLIYSTAIGGIGEDLALDMVLDASGHAFVTGRTTSFDFPLVSPAFNSYDGLTDGFVLKLSPDGSSLVYSSYLGGNGDDQGEALVLDPSGNALVTGKTTSSDFPRVNALQATRSGEWDAFVTKFLKDGSSVAFSTYLGGGGIDIARDIALDDLNRIYLTGLTTSKNFPLVHPVQPALGGNSDVFLVRLDETGTSIDYSTFLGGKNDDFGTSLAIDSSRNAWITGMTLSPGFPRVNALQ